MKSIINEIWYGRIFPQESDIYDTPQAKELLSYTARHREALEEGLTAAQREVLDKMLECRNEFDALTEEAVFAHGFRLGAQMMLDVMQTK